MSKRIFLFAILATAITAISCTSRDKLAIISAEPSAETDSLETLLLTQGYDCSKISMEDDFTDYDLIWYHRSDTSEITDSELNAGERITSYLENGGRLILSMDAVRLLNAWGLESKPVELSSTDAIDYGFGRKVGFHGFRSHPLFDGMFGGAYVWHGYEDNSNRVWGYFGDNMPEREGSKIIATAWEYILYQPKSKIIWEESVGKGKVISIGAFLYYAKANCHRAILEKFTGNLIDYMLGKKMESKERYWTYDKAGIVFDGAIDGFAYSKTSPCKWNIPEDADALEFSATREEITLPSRRALVVCEERGGIKEIWTHPIMSLKDYTVTAWSGGNSVVLNSPASDVEFRYNALIRKYELPDGSLIKEVLTADNEKPLTLAHYEWDGKVDSLCISFSSNMRYMWPYEEDALGSLHCGWSAKGNIYSVRDGEDEFVSIIGADLPANLLYERRRGDYIQIDAAMTVSTEGENACNVVMAASNEGPAETVRLYRKAMKNPEKLFTSSAEHYRKYLADNVSIETPDPVFNEGYRWATVSAGQFLAETPGLGTALMAGYSSSLRGWGGGHRVSGRPGYAWYFGRDSELAAFAFLASGDFEAVKSTIKLLADYQGVNGTIFHELTTSGSNHFDASDATPLFVVLVSEYLKASGDIKFVKEMMPNVYKAMDFCFTTDTDGDHLIEIEHVGHGWLEGGDYFAGRTEFYLGSIWLRALLDGAELAELFGCNSTAERYRKESELVEEALKGFWNEEKGYYNYGINYDLSYTTAQLALASVPVWLGVTEPEKAYTQMCKYAGDDFSTDWGVRQTNDPRNEEQVGAYDESNIWPLFTGSVSLAEYCSGRFNQGFDHMMASLLCYQGATHGRVPEVLRGNSYRSGGITRHQCWSETAVTGPAIQGMIGFKANALKGRSEFSPRLPFDWRSFSASKLKSGKVSMDISMEKNDSSCLYSFNSNGRQEIAFSPAFPPASEIYSVELNGKPLDFSTIELQEYSVLNCNFTLDGKAELSIRMKEGKSVLPSYRMAEDRGKSLGIRIMSQKAEDGVLKVRVQGKADSEAVLNYYDKGEKQSRKICFDKENEINIEL